MDKTMHVPTRAYGQQNAYAIGADAVYPEQAHDIREASLRNKAEEAGKYLTHAHELMGQLEEAIHGPKPESGTEGAPQPNGLRYQLQNNSERAATLVSRLSTLLGSL